MTCQFETLRLRQLFDSASSTYTYFIWDMRTRGLVLIDPVAEQFERDHLLVSELNLRPQAIIETHLHADHMTSIYLFKEKYPELVSYISAAAAPCEHDHFTRDGETLTFGGELNFKVYHTPGHTSCSACYHVGPWLFSGDTLLIRGCGRTDFQEGNSKDLWHSVRSKLFNLERETIVYPGHDYKGRTASTIAEEIKYNPRLNLSVDLPQFEAMMAGLKLSAPALIDVAPASNRGLGRTPEF